jgi:hypothetical protein
MLNKEICQQCKSRPDGKWSKSDDGLWEQELVVCSYAFPTDEGMAVTIYSFSEAMAVCPYRLEHLMSENHVE